MRPSASSFRPSLSGFLFSGACFALAGCTGGDAGTGGGTPTYAAQVAPLVDRHCVDCHQPGGIGSFRLDTYEDLTAGDGAVARLALQEMEAGRMPPWLPDPDCRPLRDQRVLTDGDKDVFRRWIDAGFPRGADTAGDDGDEDAAGADFPATHTLAVSEGYTPDPERPDDYRCFILDVDEDRDLYLRGTRVVPDADAIVHHVLLYALEPSQRAQVEQADADEAGPGYTCFGAPLPTAEGGADGLVDAVSESGFGLPQTLAGWVPGMLPEVSDPGMATRIPAGSPLVVQMHYNLLTSAPIEDATVVELILDDEPPEQLTRMRPAPILDLDIPAGDPAARHELVYRNYGDDPLVIRSFLAHMHLLGKEMTATVTRAGGGEEEACLLDIPDWDFDWQQTYTLPADDLETLAPGDGFRLSCVHDNSVENQAVVDGERLTPVDVSWGDGSLDEMCLLYVETVEPYAPRPLEPPPRCAAAPDCLEDCEGPRAECLLSCQALDFDCAVCSIEGLVDCAATPDACGLPFLQAQECLFACGTNSLILEGSIGRCMESECPAAYASLTGCLEERIDDAACQDSVQACGLTEL